MGSGRFTTPFHPGKTGAGFLRTGPMGNTSMPVFTLTGIVDSTLREGEQTAGFEFSFKQKCSIVKGLSALGIEEIELGVATPRSPELVSLAAEAADLVGTSCRLSLWSRCRDEDIAFAHRCQPDILSLSVPVSDLHLQDRMGCDRRWVIETLNRSIQTALEMGFPAVSVGLEDATRADFRFLARAVETAAAAGAARLRLADTVGIASPAMITDLVREVISISQLPIGVHTHNDFGMATANAVAALEAGARWVDATVLGLGERSGNCRLEELVGYLSLIKGDDRYNPEELAGLCELVAQSARISVSPYHPVVGDRIFTCETGLHIHGLSGNPQTYEPFDPVLVGKQRVFRFGAKTGRRAVQGRLASLGVTVSREEAENLVIQIRRIAAREKKLLDDRDLLRLARQGKAVRTGPGG